MKIWGTKILKAAFIAVVFMQSGLLIAQSTDSTIRIEVIGSNGLPLADTKVEVIHEPTGKSQSFTSSGNGKVIARGLKVGGPYTVKFSDGSGKPVTDLYMAVGQTASTVLEAGAGSSDGIIEEVVVLGILSSGETNEGPGATFSRDRLDSTPSLNRDISSLLQQDARANFDTNTGNLSIAGANNRFNSLTIDGIRQNDDFGLNLNGSPTNRSPISLDAIESIALNIAPFGVEYGSFQGGNINVVTKSGTNEFHGTAFGTFSDESLIGDESEGEDLESPDFEDIVWGVSGGGPIIKDTLYFFASYEEAETKTPFPFSLGNEDGVASANEIDLVTQAEMDRALQIARDVYNYDGGTFSDEFGTSDERLLIKLDWDINDYHRLSATYQNTDGTKVVDDFTFFRNPTFASPSSNRFNSRQELTAYSVNIFSNWTDKINTEFKYASKEVATDNRSVGASGIGEAHIGTENGGTIHIGPDHFRHYNDLDNDRTTVKLKLDYALNDNHTITLGYERDELKIFNAFIPWSQGEFFYNSLDDYENRRASSVAYGNAVTLNPIDRAAVFETVTDTFYIQDEWYVSEDLKLTFGLRYETLTNDDVPAFNPSFLARTGVRNDYVFDDEDLVLPRFGFEYKLGERTVVKGGIGQFGGGTPNVWLSNVYAQDGIGGTFRAQVRNGPYDQLDGIPQEALDIAAAVNANADVDAILPGTKISSVWKYNIGVDHYLDLSAISLGDDWRLSVDVLVTEVEDAFVWAEERNGTVGTAPDGRSIRAFSFSRDTLLQNTSSGGGEVITLSLAKDFDTDYGVFSLNTGYSYQDIDEVNPGARFTAFDTYGSPAHVDPGDQLNGVTYPAHTETEHRVTASLNWSDNLFGDNITSVTLTYAGRTGKNYSYTYQGRGPFGGYGLLGDFSPKLLYVPTGVDDPLVTYGANADSQAFNDFIDGEDCLKGARGRILSRNSCENGWVHRWDLRISQEIAMTVGVLQAFVDVENLGNLLNDDWGRYEEHVFNTPAISASFTEDGSQFVYDNFNGKPGKAVYRVPSVWKAQIGLRYTF